MFLIVFYTMYFMILQFPVNIFKHKLLIFKLEYCHNVLSINRYASNNHKKEVIRQILTNFPIQTLRKISDETTQHILRLENDIWILGIVLLLLLLLMLLLPHNYDNLLSSISLPLYIYLSVYSFVLFESLSRNINFVKRVIIVKKFHETIIKRKLIRIK